MSNVTVNELKNQVTVSTTENTIEIKSPGTIGPAGVMQSITIDGNNGITPDSQTYNTAINTISLGINASDLRSHLSVEDGATADQTNAEIRAAVEAATDSNVFTNDDHTKLNGIETSATADQTNSEIKTAYEANSNTNAFTDADHTKLDGIEASATADQTASEIKTLYESNSDTNEFTNAEKVIVGVSLTDSDFSSDGFLRRSGGSGSYSVDTNTYLTGNETVTFTGDSTGTGSTSVALTHANSGVSAGTYGNATQSPQITVDTKGRITSASNVDIDNVNIAEGVAISLSIALG
tara:strand:+ start:148 stop:1029 length:882 start_codon:yes stop_codon:yes gene_type:complete